MLCHHCDTPMKTEDGSEQGISTETTYETSEIKFCPKCKRRVKEEYRCEEIKLEQMPF